MCKRACMTCCQCTYPVSSFALRYAFARWLLFIPTTAGGCWAFPRVCICTDPSDLKLTTAKHISPTCVATRKTVYTCVCVSDPVQSLQSSRRSVFTCHVICCVIYATCLIRLPTSGDSLHIFHFSKGLKMKRCPKTLQKSK